MIAIETSLLLPAAFVLFVLAAQTVAGLRWHRATLSVAIAPR